MSDYSKGKIYKIECNITNDVYYGSTVQSLSQRLTLHKYSRNCQAINIIDRGNYTCKIIEEYPCNSKYELEQRERYYIENNMCINKHIPTRTIKEWRENNREHLLQKEKEWRENNKEHKAQKNKEYREKNKEQIAQKSGEQVTCECGCKVTRCKLQRHRKSKKHLDLINTIIN